MPDHCVTGDGKRVIFYRDGGVQLFTSGQMYLRILKDLEAVAQDARDRSEGLQHRAKKLVIATADVLIASVDMGTAHAVLDTEKAIRG